MNRKKHSFIKFILDIDMRINLMLLALSGILLILSGSLSYLLISASFEAEAFSLERREVLALALALFFLGAMLAFASNQFFVKVFETICLYKNSKTSGSELKPVSYYSDEAGLNNVVFSIKDQRVSVFADSKTTQAFSIIINHGNHKAFAEDFRMTRIVFGDSGYLVGIGGLGPFSDETRTSHVNVGDHVYFNSDSKVIEVRNEDSNLTKEEMVH